MRDHLILRKLKVWCLLLLAAVFAHALLPVSIPEARASGSPFSPSTVEVSTGHTHRPVAVRQAAPRRDPPGGAMPLLLSPQPAASAAYVRGGHDHPGRIAAPARLGWNCALSQPRAPPFA